MKKISLIITGALLALATNLTLAASADNADAQHGKWSVKFGLDVATEIRVAGYVPDEGIGEGLIVGGEYSDVWKKVENGIFKYDLGVSYALGRDYDHPSVSYSLDGLVVHANLSYYFAGNSIVYLLGGLNYGMTSDTSSVGQKVESDGIGAQFGIGFTSSESISLELIMQTLPMLGAMEADLSTTTLAVKYAL